MRELNSMCLVLTDAEQKTLERTRRDVQIFETNGELVSGGTTT